MKNHFDFLSSPIIYGSQVSQPGGWIGLGGMPAYAKTTNRPGFGLSIQTFQAEEGILETGCLLTSRENVCPWFIKFDKNRTYV